MTHVAIDGDIICYSVGFASEHKTHVVDGVVFQYKKQANAFCVENDIPLDRIESVIDPEPVEYALSSVKRMIANICEGAECDEYTVYLTGGGNFRDELATIHPYKGNRKQPKPYHYSDIKQYLMDVQHAVLCEGQEADDAMAIACVQHGHTIATIDKDLNGVPGWHYNWNDNDLYYVDEEEANRFFYIQMLTGDSTDNIPSLFQMTGQRATAKIKEPLHHIDDAATMYEYVRQVWLDAYEKNGMCLDEQVAVVDSWLLEIGRLLWMRRESNQMWVPPTKEE